MKKNSPLWKGFLAQLGRRSPSTLNPSESTSSNLNPLESSFSNLNLAESSSSYLNQESIASTSSDSVRNNGNRVFLSFRGADTRNTFVDHLYAHLTRKGICVFKDDISLRKGDPISPQLMQAIKDSHVSVVVFSKDYAASTWCLEEMAVVADCKQEANQTVFSVFYDVDPSHVRHQSGPYKKPFVKHISEFKKEPHKVHRWKRAMEDLASSAGWDVRNKPEFQMIENLVEAIIKVLNRNFSGIPNDLIGIQLRVQELENILKNDEVQVLGIWGMSGIGKTTQTTALYDKISHKFNGCCFIRDVSEIYKKHVDGASVIQKQILLQTFKEENIETCDSVELSKIIEQRLHNTRVLIVLDNVDRIQQLRALAIDPKKLLKGSRMIITTTDKKILKLYSANVIHEVSLLNDNDARELFYKKAFISEDQISDYVELIPNILKYAQRLPLAIEVIGSCLRDCNVEEWENLLHRFESDPDDEIMNALQKCVDGLQFHEREIFLHIACFFNGEKQDYVDRILKCCELFPCNGISRMVDRSLITLRDEEIYMHEMLKELGKKIVRSQHLHEPERWSRLWLYKDFSRVLTTDLGANNVQAIVLDKREDITECSMEGMSRMKNLRLLILYHSTFSGSLDYLSPKLRYLLWNDYPFNSLPSNFIAIDLVELNMPNSSIRSVWEGRKKFPNMKRIDLSNSKYLGESPDFSEIPKLERLDLSGCTSLSQVHPSIGLLEKLTFLSLQNCNNLVSINFDKKSNIRSLRVLLLCGCTKLENTPDFTSATNLKYLDMDGCTSLSLIDESIGSLANLRYLNLRDCKNVVTIPDTIITMWSLQTLDLRGCLKLMNLPLGITVNASYLMPLIFLDISFCNLLELPDAIGRLMCLERMNLQGNNFVSIPDLLRLGRLAYLNLSHCSKLECLPQLPLNNDTPAGRYFKTVSGSRDHRSGLYAFDCPEMDHNFQSLEDEYLYHYWLARLIREPNHFRCGFDIVLPWDLVDTSLMWFEGYKIFDGCPVIRLNGFSEVDSWLGFSFCVLFEVKKGPAVSSFSHHPFYLSFESEYTEEYFDMPLNLEVDNIDESRYAWMIYISKEHCHFVKSGAHITFKGHPHVEICRWGIRSIFVQDIDGSGRFKVLGARPLSKHYIDFDYVKNSNNSFGPKIQLPYNWLVTDEDEAENINAKAKGKGLSYAGL